MKGLSLNKKRGFGIISIMIALTMFVMSGVSSFAAEDALQGGGNTNQTQQQDQQSNSTNQSDSTSTEMKYLQLNNSLLAATGQEMNYLYSQSYIPYVIIVNEDKNLIWNNSTAIVWTPEELTTTQQESFLISMRTCLNLTSDTKVRNNSVYKNFKNALDSSKFKERISFVTSVGTSKVGNTTITIGNNKMCVIDNSSKKNILNFLTGSFKKSATEIVPNFGIRYEYPTGDETCKLDEDKADKITNDYINVVDCRLLSKEDTYDVSESFNCIPYVIAANGSTVNIWTQRELTTTQKSNFTVILKKLFTNTLITEVKKATNNAEYKYYTSSDTEFTEYSFAEHYMISKMNKKISVKDTKDGCMSWYVGGHIKLSNSESTMLVCMKDCRTTTQQPENPQPENPQPENPQPENPQPENPQPENPQPENPQPENPQPENPQPENPQPENPQPENSQPENSQPENPQPENSQPGSQDAPVEMAPPCNNGDNSNDIIIEEPNEDINNDVSVDVEQPNEDEVSMNDSTPDTGDNSLAIYYAILGMVSLGMAVYILKCSKSEI